MWSVQGFPCLLLVVGFVALRILNALVGPVCFPGTCVIRFSWRVDIIQVAAWFYRWGVVLGFLGVFGVGACFLCDAMCRVL